MVFHAFANSSWKRGGFRVCFFFYDFLHVKWNQTEPHSLEFVKNYHKNKLARGSLCNFKAQQKGILFALPVANWTFLPLGPVLICCQWHSSISVYSSTTDWLQPEIVSEILNVLDRLNFQKVLLKCHHISEHLYSPHLSSLTLGTTGNMFWPIIHPKPNVYTC